MTYIDTADVAKQLRLALKAEFPGQKFSVRISRYAGGSAIDVRWTDGPQRDTVDRVCERFEGASFDGMTDMKSYHDTMVANPDGSVDVVHYGADFIQPHREVSPERHALICELYEACIGRPYDPCDSAQLPDSYCCADPRVDWDAVLRGRLMWSTDMYGRIREVL